MDEYAYLVLGALVCAPSLFAISSAVRCNRDGKPRSRAINVMLVVSFLAGTICGGFLLVMAAAMLQVKTFVTLAAALFSIMLSFMPFYIAYWALRAINGAERWHGGEKSG